MKQLIILLFTLLLIPLISFAKQTDEAAILELLTTQVAAWNKGNIEGYMHGYWDNDSLLFIGSRGARYGYKITLLRYKEAYPDTAHMGKLSTTISRMQRLSKNYYFVVGSWALQRSVGNISGSFTLLFRKIKKKWVIISDHSS